MSSNLDDLCVLPHVGPETQGILRDSGYESYSAIALADPLELHHNCDICLSHTSEIINVAIDEMACDCPKCGQTDLSPVWGGYPGGLDDQAKAQNDFFCADCLWVGAFDNGTVSSETLLV
jgi:hypothetical protein